MGGNHASAMIRGTPFYPRAAALNERQQWTAWDEYHIVDSYIDWRFELAKIRSAAAVLDQSPLAKHFIAGPDAERFVNHLIPRDVTRMDVGQAYFTPWCNEDGSQVGDGVVVRLEADRFVLCSDRMMRWLERNSPGFNVDLTDATDDFGILALQGPASRDVLEAVTGADWSSLRFSRLRRTTIAGVDVMLLRQGFTGELGYEFWVPRDGGVRVWDALFSEGSAFGLQAAGLHALDVARIEAGLVLPGYDYTPAALDPVGSPFPTSAEHRTTPLELNMGRFIDFDKNCDFLGKAALWAEHQSGPRRRLLGIVVNWPAIIDAYSGTGFPPEVAPRIVAAPMPILQEGVRIGRTSSVTWSPTLGEVVGFAHVDASSAIAGTPVKVEWNAPDIGRIVVSGHLRNLPHYKLRRAADPA